MGCASSREAPSEDGLPLPNALRAPKDGILLHRMAWLEFRMPTETKEEEPSSWEWDRRWLRVGPGCLEVWPGADADEPECCLAWAVPIPYPERTIGVRVLSVRFDEWAEYPGLEATIRGADGDSRLQVRSYDRGSDLRERSDRADLVREFADCLAFAASEVCELPVAVLIAELGAIREPPSVETVQFQARYAGNDEYGDWKLAYLRLTDYGFLVQGQDEGVMNVDRCPPIISICFPGATLEEREEIHYPSITLVAYPTCVRTNLKDGGAQEVGRGSLWLEVTMKLDEGVYGSEGSEDIDMRFRTYLMEGIEKERDDVKIGRIQRIARHVKRPMGGI